ncbi:lipopolysaccharide biosynthesis protein [Hydrogenophaga taeniospiralis]|uniref:lipopolysaccharide biosynthesis protein n=1 Tax=Hydrogenophaga taeniospiralis TaxID=65656 RepID=UPI001CFBF71A|nr:lipopolysaccharide biosynthesis protein [Hydrogenophaga taeniospiralis]MCB4362553.1 lipopolysaccharide biosynthesis protein [Hydrogenophaga taeniospiralis]
MSVPHPLRTPAVGLSSIARRIASGAGAYGYAQAVSIGTQLVSLPLFLHHWDMATYGAWLALTALPFYLSLADAGISTASSNQMIGLITQGQKARAAEVFQSAVAFLTSVSLLILLIVGATLLLLPTTALEVPQWKAVLMLLSISVVLGLFCSLAEVIYKATGGYAAGTYLVTTGRLVEWAGGLTGLVLTQSFIGVAASALLARLGYTLLCLWLSQRRTDFLRWGVRRASLADIKQAAAPGALFLSLSLTNALSLQGFTLLVAATLGPAATAVFNTYRTVARIVVQVTNALSNPLWPELTALKGQRDDGAFWKLYRRANRLGLAIAAAGALLVYGVSPWLLDLWTHGQIPFTATSMALFLGYAAVCSATQVPRVVLMSINRHAGLAAQSLLAAVVSLVVAWLVWGSAGMAGVVGAMLLGEALVWLTAMRAVRRLRSTKTVS